MPFVPLFFMLWWHLLRGKIQLFPGFPAYWTIDFPFIHLLWIYDGPFRTAQKLHLYATRPMDRVATLP
jgi:hypothetical protein